MEDFEHIKRFGEDQFRQDFDLVKPGVVQGINGLSYFSIHEIAKVLHEITSEAVTFRILTELHKRTL